MESYILTNAEHDVMETLWESEKPVRTRYLLDKMSEKGKNWKRQTLNTLLFRLEDKGVITRRRGEIDNFLSESELMQTQTKRLLDNLYGGKLENFCAALAGSKNLPEEEVKRLYELIDGWGK